MSIAGQWLACLLLGIGLTDLVVAILPGAGLALMCAIAVIAGKITASACGTQGVATLLLIVGPPALVYCWRESSTAMRMFADTFGRRETAPNRRGPGASMNQVATLRVTSPEPELQILPLERARAEWDALADSHPDATLYHRGPWLEVLRRAFGVRPSVAIIGDSDSTQAACLLAPGGNPIRRSLISLPFSDFCPPLASERFSPRLADVRIGGHASKRTRLEIRGVAGILLRGTFSITSSAGRSICRARSRRSKRAADREVQAPSASRPRGRRQCRMLPRRRGDRDCFFELQLESRRRLGVPSQPLKFFRTVHEVFAQLDSIEVWFASHQGNRIAAVVVLRDGDDLHAKWSARDGRRPDGASHLIFMSIAEQHAQRARALDFGRTDSRNRGLSRFKRELGATATDLPYSYFPQMPSVTSAENLTGVWQTASRVWRNLPLPVARVLNNVTYRYLA